MAPRTPPTAISSTGSLGSCEAFFLELVFFGASLMLRQETSSLVLME